MDSQHKWFYVMPAKPNAGYIVEQCDVCPQAPHTRVVKCHGHVGESAGYLGTPVTIAMCRLCGLRLR